MNSSRPAAATLVLTNALVLLGPLALGWNLAALLMLYWLELVFVGLINIAKMAWASRLGELGKSRSYQAIFFIAHYATFCVLYGVALQMIIAGPDAVLEGNRIALAIAVMALLASHGLSFGLNYVHGQEFAKMSSLEQMFVPYRRLLPVQIATVIGATVVRGLGEPALGLAALVCIKLGTDLLVHLRHHNALTRDRSSPPQETS